VIVALVHIFYQPNSKMLCCFVIEISDLKLSQSVGWLVVLVGQSNSQNNFFTHRLKKYWKLHNIIWKATIVSDHMIVLIRQIISACTSEICRPGSSGNKIGGYLLPLISRSTTCFQSRYNKLFPSS